MQSYQINLLIIYAGLIMVQFDEGIIFTSVQGKSSFNTIALP